MNTLKRHKKNVTMDFYSDEIFKKFYVELKNLIKPCRFEKEEGTILKALAAFCINNNELKERLFREDVTLDKMVDFFKASEVAGRNVKIIKTGNKTANEVIIKDVIKVLHLS